MERERDHTPNIIRLRLNGGESVYCAKDNTKLIQFSGYDRKYSHIVIRQQLPEDCPAELIDNQPCFAFKYIFTSNGLFKEISQVLAREGYSKTYRNSANENIRSLYDFYNSESWPREPWIVESDGSEDGELAPQHTALEPLSTEEASNNAIDVYQTLFKLFKSGEETLNLMDVIAHKQPGSTEQNFNQG